ncbi:MAG TPA: cyclic dehypoxanthinyl futalosine synthase [Vicinamibacteria bacterium]|nr:cyclic dehypoxanthinyl futalosine synthase [Vicinamibacteria bacterium]
MNIETIRTKVRDGERLAPEDGLFLLREASILDLGQLSMEVRNRRHPEPVVTYVVDTNPNYTNVCNVDCTFCAFYRPPEHPEAYTHSIDEMMERIARSVERGVTTVLMQGGVNSELPLDYYIDMVRTVRARFPDVTPHFWSAVEIEGMAAVSRLTVREVLLRLKQAGQTTIPGGGAEILSERVRRKISHKKGLTAGWLDVHREAHAIGFRSTATMMYGHVETEEDIVEHFESIRRLQDEFSGFTAFVPWSFKPGNTPLVNKIPRHAGPNRYLRILAAARLYLDNFDHIQASWFSEGKKTGQVALHWGADDFGGTLFEENVHAATGFVNQTSTEEVKTLIREAGFRPAQRTTLYQILRYD